MEIDDIVVSDDLDDEVRDKQAIADVIDVNGNDEDDMNSS